MIFININILYCQGLMRYTFLETSQTYCKLQDYYKKLDDSIKINNKFYPLSTYKNIIQEKEFRNKNCFDLINLIKHKYNVLKYTIIIKMIDDKIYIVGLDITSLYSKNRVFELSVCFNESEYKEIYNNKFLKNQVIKNKKLLNEVKNILKSVYNYKIYQCITLDYQFWR